MKRMNFKKYFITALIVSIQLFFSLNAAPVSLTSPYFDYPYSLPINIINTTGMPGFFGTCTNEIGNGSEAICSIPEAIGKGEQTILIPPYPNSYPVFSTDGINYYTCGTLDKPLDQLFFSVSDISSNSLILESFIPDQNKNNIAVLCGMQPKS